MELKIQPWLKKYRAVLLVFLCGILLMSLPGSRGTKKQQDPPPEAPGVQSLEQTLSGFLSRMEGAGQVQVLLTEKEGSRTVYQCDRESRQGESRTRTVLLQGSGREQQGLVQQLSPPRYQGAVVLCQGADRAAVRLAIVEAVTNAAGLSSDRVTVLKMK